MDTRRTTSDKLLRSLAAETAGDQLRTFRFYMAFRWASGFAVLIHMSVFALFWSQGVQELAYFNILSIAVYVAAFLANERGHHSLGFGLGLVEILLHQILAIYFIGWDSGFQYYILAVSTVVFFLPTHNYIVKFGVFGLTLAVFLFIYAAIRPFPPVYPLSETMLGAMSVVNIITCFAVMAVIAFYYSLAADMAEGAIGEEHQKSEALLLNILPTPVAQRLKEGHRGSPMVMTRPPSYSLTLWGSRRSLSALPPMS